MSASDRPAGRPGVRARRRPAAAAAVAWVLLVAGCTRASDAEAPPADRSPGAGTTTTSAPRGDLPGWRQVFVDDFDRDQVGDSWNRYSGHPGKDRSDNVWDESKVSVRDGKLILHASRSDGSWETGGVCNCELSQTYGKWEMRMRVDRNDEIKYASLLWPTEGWPPEIDFAEDGGGDRDYTLGTLHYRADSDNKKIQRDVETDFARWRVAGVEWTPDTVRYTLDGRVWATVESDRVPDEPMWLGFQLEADGCAMHRSECTGERSPSYGEMEVDWVTVYARE